MAHLQLHRQPAEGPLEGPTEGPMAALERLEAPLGHSGPYRPHMEAECRPNGGLGAKRHNMPEMATYASIKS